ncbi:uncharacterized protein LOC123532268 [Mercenaria mercenaria]|uniref:uncharacterized protein LOC123532268 n=1 Tax=Mercenaria mercenaria TaxID=6596 RepID=UPI00234EF516|nr:uncharacterized protein LOC123532268 [Mercenaria mercenaria]
MIDRLRYFSDWHRAKRAFALCLRFRDKLYQKYVHTRNTHNDERQKQHSQSQSFSHYQSPSVSELQAAELQILKLLQSMHFKHEIATLKRNSVRGSNDRNTLKNHRKILQGESHLLRLDPFLDQDGIIRVGGRIRQLDVPSNVKHPIIVPKGGHITDLIIRHFHQRVYHQGRGITINEIRDHGLWIIGISSGVSSVIYKCVTCRRLRGMVQNQKMSDLPTDRLEPAPPFTYCAVDYFGPILIKDGRKELKRYGVLFTCLLCRAVHVETANTLETDLFINCLRRFISIRGPTRQLRSDRGTNFVGVQNEFHEAASKLDSERIQEYLLKENCDLIDFEMNVPSASHMGGVWERQIRSVRNVLDSLLLEHGTNLDDESLRTFLCEASAIVNSRPLTVDSLNDPLSPTPLTPNHLLTKKSKVILPPPANFQRVDLYSRKRWRRVQYLVDQFWVRWKSKFLQNLQTRNKWHFRKRNVQIGDIVLLKDDNLPRNQWRLGRVVETTTDTDGLVRNVKLALPPVGSGKQSSLVYFERPIHKLIILLETEEVPVGKP